MKTAPTSTIVFAAILTLICAFGCDQPKSDKADARKTGSELPGELAYLKPVLQKIEALSEAEMSVENSAADKLMDEAIQPRTNGMSRPDAKKLLLNDHALLKQWLTNPQVECPRGYYVLGFLEVSATVD